jgi:membrane associated rhomboid family serine protease
MPTSRVSTSRRSAVSAEIPLAFICLIWAVFAVDTLLPFLGLRNLGILPRTIGGLAGVLFAPLLHAGLFHIAANTVPLFVMLFLLNLQSAWRWAEVLGQIWLLSGFGTWVIGRGGVHHIGASGLVYGLLTYLIAAGFYQRDWKSILIGAVVLFSYGGLLLRILPTYWFISWEGHLCGVVAGVLVASWMPRKPVRK